MPKPRKSGRRKPSKLEPADVLAGRVRPSVEDLIQLITLVNPTGEELPKAEVDRRYKEKSALQSLLVNRFSDELAVVPDPENEAVVLLRHRYGARDACHAVLDDLDPDARAWVRLQLDFDPSEEGVASGEARSGPLRSGASDRRGEDAAAFTLEDSDPASLIERSRAALAEFDFDLARNCLEKAMSLMGGSLDASRPWLELLVDHLGLFEEALQGAERLPKRTLKEESIRALLALAAVRAGRIEEATRWATALTGGRAGEVHLALAEAAIARADLAGAEAHLAHAERVGADPIAIAVQRKMLSLKKAQKHQASESAIETQLAAGNLEEAARQARALQALWPESPVARAALRAAADERRAAELREALAAVEALGPGCEPKAELEALRRALSLGGDRAELGRRISTLETEIRAREEEATVARVADLMELEDPAPGLLEYLNLVESLRDRVRQRSSSTMLPWLEKLDAPQLGARARQAAVAAVLALDRAVREREAGRVEDVARLFQDHRKILAGLADADGLLAAARIAAEDRQAAEARSALRAFHQALSVGDLVAARAASGSVKLDRLDAGEAQAARRSLAELDAAEETARLVAKLEARTASGDFLEARDLASTLAGRTEDPDAAKWRGRAEEMREQLRRTWRTKVICDPDEGVAWPDDPKSRFMDHGAVCCLTQDGSKAVEVLTAAGRFFARVIEVDTGRTVELVSMRPPTNLEGHLDAILAGDTVLVTDSGGRAIRLSLPTWEVLSFHDVQPLVLKGEVVERFLLAPGDRFLWLQINRPSDFELRARVVDLEGFRVHREISNLRWTCLFVAGERPRFFVRRSSRKRRPAGFDFLGVDGSTELQVQEELTGDASVVAVHPDGARHLLLVVDNEGIDLLGESDELLPTHLVLLSPEGRVVHEHRLPDTHPEGRVCLATSRDARVTFAVIDPGEGLPLLVAFAPEGNGLRKLYQVKIPERHRLVQDSGARRVVLLVHGREGLQAVPLGATPPDLTGIEDQDDSLPRFGLKWRYCAWQSADQGEGEVAEGLARYGQYRNLSAEAKDRSNETYLRDHENDPGAIERRCRWLVEADRPAAVKLLERATALHPGSAPLALVRAHLQAEEARWTEVERELSVVNPEELEAAARKHLHHLLGMVSFYQGDLDGAHSHFLEGIDMEGKADERDAHPRGAAAPQPQGRQRTTMLRRKVKRNAAEPHPVLQDMGREPNYPPRPTEDSGPGLIEGGCDLAGWLNLSEALEDGPLPQESEEKYPLVNRLVSAILLAEEALVRGDLVAASRAIDRPIVWRTFELQSLARLAEVRLKREKTTPTEELRTALALSRLLDVAAEEDHGYKNDLPLLDRRWDSDRLAALSKRAEAWLTAWDEVSVD
jgi:hypothetical protein